MMISPEGYYEMNLKGKSPSQIVTCIRGLKKEIGHCSISGGKQNWQSTAG